METKAPNKESKKQHRRKTLGLYSAEVIVSCQCSDFLRKKNDVENGFKTLDMNTLDTFLYQNCTTMNYALIIFKSPNSQTKKQ